MHLIAVDIDIEVVKRVLDKLSSGVAPKGQSIYISANDASELRVAITEALNNDDA